ncbi:hypothetical protein [Kocuria flava]|uniref:hypothetical protein n=1 Tax=Kocuria flava TaxID=446860 RepID=UPI002F95D4A1
MTLPRTTRPARPLRTAAAAALLAGLLAALLGTDHGTAARWSATAPLEVATITTGGLELVLEDTTVTLHHEDLDATGAAVAVATDLTGLDAVPGPTAPGSTVVVRTRAVPVLEGTRLAADFVVDAGAGAPRVEITPADPGSPLPAATGAQGRAVVPARDGAAYDVTVRYDLPGAAGATAAPGPLTLSLAQR